MRFRGLKTRLILPLLVASLVAASLVAVASYWLAQRATAAQLEQRFAAIRRAIEQTNFPLSRGVLMTLSELTSADWITLGASGEVLEGTTSASDPVMTATERRRWQELLRDVPVSQPSGAGQDTPTILRVDSNVYHVKRFRMASGVRRTGDKVAGDSGLRDSVVQDVVVMFDDADWRDIRLQAAAAPLVTGLSTILLLSSVALYLASRLVIRLKRLQREVDTIAQGNFSSHLVAGPDDEIGRLGRAVETMATQLQQMWDALGREHGQRFLHQIAGGLAHNLRNSLTGARMAVELHARDHQQRSDADGGAAVATADDEGLRIAIEQLDQAEDYVRRLLLVSKGKQDVDRPATVSESLKGVIGSLDNTARHLGVALKWSVDHDAAGASVADGPTLTSAVTNLVWNAIQAGKQVSVDVTIESAGAADHHRESIRIDVADDGPGPSPEVADTLFEPLITTKPEGLGLGLPLVKRAAESLGGDVRWYRRDAQTVFSLTFPVAL
jgi:signal transduction histidine kinase